MKLLSKQEHHVWAAAYAAAWLDGWCHERDSYGDVYGPSPFQQATEVDHAERAVLLADAALMQLRRHRPTRGKGVPCEDVPLPDADAPCQDIVERCCNGTRGCLGCGEKHACEIGGPR